MKTSLYLNYEKFSQKSPINALNKARRLMYARDHQTWNIEWQNDVWSKVKKWNSDGPDSCTAEWYDNR